MVVTVTLNPAIDQTVYIPGFEAGRVNRVAGCEFHAGGKGVNVAGCLADLGVEAVATGFLGRDNPELFEAFFAQRKIADRFIRIPGRTRTGIKIADTQSGQTTDINFPGPSLAEADMSALQELLEELAGPGRWFVFSGSVPPGAGNGAYARLIDAVHTRGGYAALDASGKPFREGLAARPELVKPNVDELEELLGQSLDTVDSVRAAGESLLAKGVQLAAISMGGDGAVFLNGEEALRAIPPHVPVCSTVGAGDAMVGGMLYAMHQGYNLADIARYGTACGAYAVMRTSKGIEDKTALEGLLRQVALEQL